MSSSKKPAWVAGSPPGRGRYWIAWSLGGIPTVSAVDVGPALIHAGDPDASLLLKLLGGPAYNFESARSKITHYLPLVAPELP